MKKLLIGSALSLIALFGTQITIDNYAEASEMDKQMEWLDKEVERSEKELNETIQSIADSEWLSANEDVEVATDYVSLGTFKITYYWQGEDSYGDMTATGVRAKPNQTIAVDPTVIPYGTVVRINGIDYVAEDCGGAVKGNVIDIFVEKPRHERDFVEVFMKKEK